MTFQKLATIVVENSMTIEKLAAMVVEGFDFMKGELRGEFRAEVRSVRDEIQELRESVDYLETSMNAKFLAVHNRIDDLIDTRAKRDELVATNVRVTRIEGHLGLA